MENTRTPSEGERMRGQVRLRIADVACSQVMEVAPRNEVTPLSLVDLSIPDGQPEPDHTEWRARVVIPLDKPDNVSLAGVRQAVRHALNGRLPDTYCIKPPDERFVVTFALRDTSEHALSEASAFALSLAAVLEVVADDDLSLDLRLEHHGRAVQEIPLAQ